jgi:hypothetical protein
VGITEIPFCTAQQNGGAVAIVIKTIRGRQYRYEQKSRRIGGKVVTKSVYIGPVGGGVRRKGVVARIGEFLATNLRREHYFDWEAALREQQQRDQQQAASKAKALNELHEKYGLVVGPSTPTPIDKPVRDVIQPNVEPSTGQKDAPSDVSDGAKGQ